MPDYNNNNSTDDLIAPVKKGSLGVTPSATDTSEGTSTCGEPVEDGLFTYFRDRLLDKQTATRNTDESVDYVALSSDNSDQKAKTTGSKAIYVESNAPRSATPVASDVNMLPHQTVPAENESVGEYSYLEPAINYDDEGNENCYRSTNILYNQQQAPFLDGTEFTSYTSRKFTRAKGTFDAEVEFNCNSYEGSFIAGNEVLRNDGFCFIAKIQNAAEYGTLLLDFEQNHPQNNRITPYVLNNHIDDPANFLGTPTKPPHYKTFAAVSTSQLNFFRDPSLLSVRSLYNKQMEYYEGISSEDGPLNSRLKSYPYGSANIDTLALASSEGNNASLLPFTEYLYSMTRPSASPFLNVIHNDYSEPLDADGEDNLGNPWAGGLRNIDEPFTGSVSKHVHTAIYADPLVREVIVNLGIHKDFNQGSATGGNVIWNKDPSGNRINTANNVPTVSNILRVDNSWRPYEIIVYRGTLNYDASTGKESYDDGYQEYFRFRTFDNYYKNGVFNPQDGEANGPNSGGDHYSHTETNSDGVSTFKYPVVGVNNENGKFVINFSENFASENSNGKSVFDEKNELKVAVIQDTIKTQKEKTNFSSGIFNSKASNYTFKPIHEDTIQLLNLDDTLLFSGGSFYGGSAQGGLVNGGLYLTNHTGGPNYADPNPWNEIIVDNFEDRAFDNLTFRNNLFGGNNGFGYTEFLDRNNNRYRTPTQFAGSIRQDIPLLNSENYHTGGTDWGSNGNSVLPTHPIHRPNFGQFNFANDTVFEDPWALAGFINVFREVSWFGRDLLRTESSADFDAYINSNYGTFSKTYSVREGTSVANQSFKMPQPWKMKVSLIQAENITGIEHDTSRCQSNRAIFQANGGATQLDSVEKYICGQCQQNDGAAVPDTAYQNGKNHEKVTEGYPETDKLKDHRSYQRVHDGGNLSA